MPCTGLIAYLPEYTGFFTGYLVITAGRLKRGLCMHFENRGACQSQNILNCMGIAPSVQFGCGKVRIAAYEDADVWPCRSNAFYNPLDDCTGFLAAGPSAGTKNTGNQVAALPFKDEKRLIAVLVVPLNKLSCCAPCVGSSVSSISRMIALGSVSYEAINRSTRTLAIR